MQCYQCSVWLAECNPNPDVGAKAWYADQVGKTVDPQDDFIPAVTDHLDFTAVPGPEPQQAPLPMEFKQRFHQETFQIDSTTGTEPMVVELKRSGPRWKNIGMLVNPDPDPTCLVVDDLAPNSLIADWNTMQPEAHRVRAGDVIVEVNGVSGNGTAMLERIRQSGRGTTLRMKIKW